MKKKKKFEIQTLRHIAFNLQVICVWLKSARTNLTLLVKCLQPTEDSKFKDLTFRKKLKTRVRPKRADWPFNQSLVDALSVSKKRKSKESVPSKRVND